MKLVFALLLLAPLAAFAQTPEPSAPEPSAPEPSAPEADEGPPLKWLDGPADAALGKLATLKVPEGYSFLGADDARLLLQAMQNPVDGSELGMIRPERDERHWMAFFEFDDVGYVKDDDKDALDAAAVLASVREGTEGANEMRRERGWPEVEVVGWVQEPHYDDATHNLAWAIEGRSQGETSINYNTRLLGRTGVMSVTLLVESENLKAGIAELNQLLAGYAYTDGNRYAEYAQGDKIAEYGLMGLMAGGAAAVALKTGLLQKFWKLIAAAVVGLGALVKKLFSGHRRHEPPSDFLPPSQDA